MTLLLEGYYYSYMKEKVTGRYKYAADYAVEGSLVGGVLRAGIPHGIIESIDFSGALKIPGVKAVLTHVDVPGLNAFGYFVPEQPVLCGNEVMYAGDAIAAVAATDENVLQDAINSIKVKIRDLPVVSTIDEALEGKVRLRNGGNVAYSIAYENGNYDAAEGHEDKGTYLTGAVKPMYIEPESSTAWVENGTLKVLTTTQSPEHDIMQIARSLNISDKKIEIIYPDPGGAFGGKEEIHTQIISSLLAIKTGKPVRVLMSREESGISTTKRHAFAFNVRTKVIEDMKLNALNIIAVGDAGAYLSHGPGVLEVVGSHAAGPYHIKNVKFDGKIVYTNTPPSGGMRGYGASEVNFALERHIDAVCREHGWDPLEMRMKNALRPGEEYGTGLVPISTITAYETMSAASKSPVFKMRKSASPLTRIGIGVASGMKSTSYGQGGDSAKVKLVLSREKLRVMFTTPDMGSGIRFGIVTLASRELGINEALIEVSNQDSNNPRSGTSNASRVTFMLGNALLNAIRSLKKACIERYNSSDIETVMHKMYGQLEVEGYYELPKVEGGKYKISDFIFSFITTVARVEVDSLTGKIKVTDLDIYPEAGTIINPMGYISQIEGGAIMSLGYAIYENLNIVEGKVMGKNFTFYMLPTAIETPKIKVNTLQSHDKEGPLGAKGVGELAMTSVAAAIANAVVDATGVNIDRIPISLETLLGSYKSINRLDSH